MPNNTSKKIEVEEYPFLENPIPITEQVWDKEILPLVSIDCRTYMQEKYIEDAIRGLLMQRTTFKVEILIYDDASFDRTPDIVKKYETDYPQLIKATYQIENQYGRSPKTAKFIKPHKKTGKYIAVCEGDDYWIDPYKLQKQFDFLERNPDFSMCFHSYYERRKEELSLKPFNLKHELALEDFAKSIAGIQTLTVFYRNILTPVDKGFKNKVKITGSYFWYARLAAFGKLKFINEPMAVYRVHEGGVWSSKSEYQKGKMSLQNKAAIVMYFEKKRPIHRLFKSTYIKSSLNYSIYFLKHFSIKKSLEFIKLSLAFGMSSHHFTYWFEYAAKKVRIKR